jgi:ATP-dependent helicase IRC3
MNGPALRPYQQQAGDAVERAFLTNGLNRLLVKKPTGTGKTVWFAALPNWPAIHAWRETFRAQGVQRGAWMLVIAHREELLKQAQAKIQAANPGAMVAIEQADLHASRYSDVVIASIQTLAARKYARLERLLERHTPRIVVVDEAHHAAADSYRTVLARLGFLPMADASDKFEVEAATFDDVEEMRAALTGWDAVAPKDRLLIGVTATPNRSDAIGLGCVFQTIAYAYGLKQAIDDGYLVPIKPWVIETAESLDDVHVVRGEFKQNELADAVNTSRRNQLAVDGWQAYAPGVATIGFTVDVQHAHDLAAAFRAAGHRWQALSGETPREDRAVMLRQIQNGQLDGIANCMVLTEGTDLPVVGCILHAKPTKSATLYEQMTGRGLRPYPGKTQCVVIDMVDVARRHSLQTAPILYGLPPGINTKGNELQKLADELEALREKIPNLDELLETKRYSLEELRDRATTFDVFSIPDLGAIASLVAMQWIRSGVDTFRVSYPWGDGTETLIVSPDVLGKFTVSLTLRPNADETGHRPPARQRTLAAEIEGAGAALQVAERWVEADRRSVLKLKASDAPWRSRPASDKQIAYLEKLRIPIKPGMTMGEASNAIDMVKARAGR